MLFCKFASPRSTPNRIHRWVEYLTELERRNADDLNAVQTLRNLRHEAFSWLGASERPVQVDH
jgi:hypothetical protein